MKLLSRRAWWLPLAAAQSMKGQDVPTVAAGRVGETVLEFIATILQNGGSFTATGYLTSIAGLPEAALFTDPVTRSQQTARFLLSVTATLVGRNVLTPMFVLDETGTATVSYSESPGGYPTVIASGPVTLQSSIQVTSPFMSAQAPGKGNFRVSGRLVNEQLSSFTLGGVTFQFGEPQIDWIITGTGDGTLTDPSGPVAQVVAVGNVVAGARLSAGAAKGF